MAEMTVCAISLQSVSSSILLKMFQLRDRARSSGLNSTIFFSGWYFRVMAARYRHISGFESITALTDSPGLEFKYARPFIIADSLGYDSIGQGDSGTIYFAAYQLDVDSV